MTTTAFRVDYVDSEGRDNSILFAAESRDQAFARFAREWAPPDSIITKVAGPYNVDTRDTIWWPR